MIVKTECIVLNTLKYSDSSIIAHFYTHEYGRVSCMVPGVSSGKGKFKKSYFQALNILQIDLYYKENRSLQKLKDIACLESISHDEYYFERSTITLFLAEILYRSLREEEANPPLYEYLKHAIHILNLSSDLRNFHLLFLVQLTKFLGIYPTNNHNELNRYFNLNDGTFRSSESGESSLSANESYYLSRLLSYTFSTVNDLKLSGKIRHDLIQHIVKYYNIHLHHIGEIKSLQVLRDVFA